MHYIFLVIVVFLISLQDILKKHYNAKTEKPNVFFFSLILSLSAMVFFLFQSKFKLDFNAGLIPYAIGFALSYASGLIGSFLAIKHGSLSISMLISSYSLVIPTLYGIFALNEDFTLFGIIGFLCLLVSLFLINKKSEATQKVNFIWIICLIFSFLGNGLCSLVQKLQQLEFNGGYKSEFMILSLLICTVILLFASIINKEKISCNLKLSLPSGFIAGIANGIVNFFVMVLTGLIPNAILYPSISAGGVVLGFFASVLIYKEKLSKLQLTGYFIGILSIILLNI